MVNVKWKYKKELQLQDHSLKNIQEPYIKKHQYQLKTKHFEMLFMVIATI